MRENAHSKAIPAETLAQAQMKADEILALLQPYLLALTPAERHEIPKLGAKRLSFVEKAFELAQQNGVLRPAFFDMAAFETDFHEAHGLWTLVNTVRQLLEGLEDTEMAAGSAAFLEALTFYKSVKMAADGDVPGAKAVYEALRPGFMGGRRKNGAAETETVTETVKETIALA